MRFGTNGSTAALSPFTVEEYGVYLVDSVMGFCARSHTSDLVGSLGLVKCAKRHLMAFALCLGRATAPMSSVLSAALPLFSSRDSFRFGLNATST